MRLKGDVEQVTPGDTAPYPVVNRAAHSTGRIRRVSWWAILESNQ